MKLINRKQCASEICQNRPRHAGHFLHNMSPIAGVTAVAPALSTSASAQCWTVRPTPVRPGRNLGCFLKGTHIHTLQGLKNVETLSISHHLMTERGETIPIRQIGLRIFRRSTSSRWADSFHPICVARSALAGNVPFANLYLSPLHVLFIDGALIQAAPLVNGTSIMPAVPEGMKGIEYFHIELATDAVILAKGAPVEIHLNTNGREHFPNFVQYERLDNRETGSTVPYAPANGYSGCRAHLLALLRLSISRAVDMWDRIQKAHDRIAARGTNLSPCV